MNRICSIHRGDEKCIQGLNGKPKEKIPLIKPRHIWKDNVAMDLTYIGLGFIWNRIWPSDKF